MEENGKQKYDWDTIKQDFFNSDILEAIPFIRQTLSKEADNDGNVAYHIKGWTEDKREWKRKRIEDVQKEAEKELTKELKIQLKDLLVNKRLLYGLDGKYLEILGKLQSSDITKQPTEEERRFFQNYTDKVKDIFQRLQIELGLPTNIAELQGSKEKPLVLIDLIRQAEEAEKDVNQTGNN